MLDPSQPHLYPRRVLVCLSGLTPQVITETMFGLLTKKPAFVPTELHVITTGEGRQRAERLLKGPESALAVLWRTYAPPGSMLEFDPSLHIHTITEGNQPLADITARDHHIGTADSILSILRPLVQDKATALHASLAGGRKSMSFYMGYVVSLLARDQDRMSHVLVNAPFDTMPDFAFPTNPPTELKDANGTTWLSSQARVQLADIAFVRMSASLPDQLLRGEHRFETLVAQAQAALEGVRVVLDASQRSVAVVSTGSKPVCIRLSPLEFGLYAYLAIRRQCAHDGSDGLAALTLESNSMEAMQEAPRLKQLETSLDLNSGALRADWKVDASLRERASNIKRKLQRNLAEAVFLRVRICGPGERGRRDGCYGLLGLEAKQIHFGNLPEDHHGVSISTSSQTLPTG